MTEAILITGGARRVGREMALYLAGKGYDIALHYNLSRAEAEYVARQVETLGAQCELFQADLEDSSTYEPLIAAAHKRFEKLSGLVNNAAVFDTGGFLEGDVALFEKEFRTNLQAPIFLTQAFARHAKKGAVVNMLDTCITRHKHSYFFYLLSKKALFEFTTMAAAELAPHIRVNGICPGYLLPADGWGEDYQKRLETRLPMGKTATLADIMQTLQLLLTSQAITGECIFIDGGEHLL